MSWWRTGLKGSCPEQEVDDVAFVRLHPVQLVGPNFADVQAVNVRRIQQFLRPFRIFGQAGTNQCAADLLNHLALRTLNN